MNTAESNKSTSSNDCNKKKGHIDIYTIVGLIIIGVFLVPIIAYGSYLKITTEGRCNVQELAHLKDYEMMPYEYAPYHGGRVQTRYDVIASYTYSVDGSDYTIYLTTSYGENSEPISTIPVKYNKDNPAECVFNASGFYGTYREDFWTYKKD